jgi:nucleotide-binding universal stress UspA family protein
MTLDDARPPLTILVAIDGSEHALRALQWALSWPPVGGRPTTMLLAHVHHDAPLRGAGTFVGQAALDAYLDEQARVALAPAQALCASATAPSQSLLLRGPIAQTLIDTAAAHQCDLIVLGTKGRHALHDWLTGSTAQRVISLSKIPVVLVP